MTEIMLVPENLTYNQKRVLLYAYKRRLEGKIVSPLHAGIDVGGKSYNSASSWGSRICKQIVKLGLMVRYEGGYYAVISEIVERQINVLRRFMSDGFVGFIQGAEVMGIEDESELDGLYKNIGKQFCSFMKRFNAKKKKNFETLYAQLITEPYYSCAMKLIDADGDFNEGNMVWIQ